MNSVCFLKCYKKQLKRLKQISSSTDLVLGVYFGIKCPTQKNIIKSKNGVNGVSFPILVRLLKVGTAMRALPPTKLSES